MMISMINLKRKFLYRNFNLIRIISTWGVQDKNKEIFIMQKESSYRLSLLSF